MTRKMLIPLLSLGAAVLIGVLALASCGGGELKALTDGAALLARQGSGVASPWAMFGKNSLRTRLSEHTGPPTNKLKWKYNTTGNPYYSSPAIASDGTVYIGDIGSATQAPRLYAVSASGKLKWTCTTLGSPNSPAISADGSTIYVGGSLNYLYQIVDTKIYAISSNGSVGWTYTTGGAIASSPVIGEDGTVYVGSMDGKLYALAPDGTLKPGYWPFTTSPVGAVRSSPAIGYDGTLYFGSFNGMVYAVNPDGTEKWEYQTNGGIVSSPAVGTDGTVYIGAGNNKFLAINSADGSLKWAYVTAYPVWSSPAIGADGTVYVADVDTVGVNRTGDGHLFAFYPDGILKWSIVPPGPYPGQFSSPAIGLDGTVYNSTVGSNALGATMFAVNPNGTLKWSYHLPGESGSSPAIGADGTVYTGCNGPMAIIKGKLTFSGGIFAFGPGLN